MPFRHKSNRFGHLILPLQKKNSAMFKILLWAAIGYIVYSWIQEKMGLKRGGKQTTLRQHPKSEKQQKKADDEDYIDYEEIE